MFFVRSNGDFSKSFLFFSTNRLLNWIHSRPYHKCRRRLDYVSFRFWKNQRLCILYAHLLRALCVDTSLDVFKELIELNYLGTVSLTKCVLPHMIERKQGKIVTVNSMVGIIAAPLSTGYCASKHALRVRLSKLNSDRTGLNVCMEYLLQEIIGTR